MESLRWDHRRFCPALMFIAKHPSLPLFPHLTIPVYDTPIGPTNLTSLSFSRLGHTELAVISPPEISKGSVRHFRNLDLTRPTQETRRRRPPCRRGSRTQVQRPPSSLPTCEEAPPIPTSTTPSTRVRTTGTTTVPATRPGCLVSVDGRDARIRWRRRRTGRRAPTVPASVWWVSVERCTRHGAATTTLQTHSPPSSLFRPKSSDH